MPDPRDSVRMEATARRAERRLTALERHMEMSWYEWTLRELVRYLYALGVLVLLIMVPLQMADSWMPPNAASGIDPTLAGILIVVFVAAALYLGVSVYLLLWRQGGLVDRTVRRRLGRTPAPDEKADPPVNP